MSRQADESGVMWDVGTYNLARDGWSLRQYGTQVAVHCWSAGSLEMLRSYEDLTLSVLLP